MPKFNTLKQQRKAAELRQIIEEMGQAMWSADKEYIARQLTYTQLTLKMYRALDHFSKFCKEYYGQKA